LIAMNNNTAVALMVAIPFCSIHAFSRRATSEIVDGSRRPKKISSF